MCTKLTEREQFTRTIATFLDEVCVAATSENDESGDVFHAWRGLDGIAVSEPGDDTDSIDSCDVSSKEHLSDRHLFEEDERRIRLKGMLHGTKVLSVLECVRRVRRVRRSVWSRLRWLVSVRVVSLTWRIIRLRRRLMLILVRERRGIRMVLWMSGRSCGLIVRWSVRWKGIGYDVV